MSYSPALLDTGMFPFILFPTSKGATSTAQAVEKRSLNALLAARLRSARLAPALGELSAVAREYGLLESDIGALTLQSAEAFLAALPSEIPAPEVSVDPDGEIAFDWASASEMLSVSVGANGRLTYAWDIEDLAGSRTDRLVGALPPKLREALGTFAE